MPSKPFAVMTMDIPIADTERPALDWIWHGYLARGNLTLLTSLWKAGKTTLVAGLLQKLAAGGDFMGCPCQAARTLVVSEESHEHWRSRLRVIPVGPHGRLMPRPFLLRPTLAEWNDLVEYALSLREANDLDLFVVDPLATFLPGGCESDPSTLFEMLQPLQRLAAAGVAVLILHHPRKNRSEEGNSARGSGALLGFVDIILELHRVSRLQTEQRRRRLIGLSRHDETPRQLTYQYDPATGVFTNVDDPLLVRFRDNWKQVHSILANREEAATHHELLMDWPADREKPSASMLYEWLNRGFDAKLVRRNGQGVRTDPYRYRLPNEDDEYRDRGELPPLRLSY